MLIKSHLPVDVRNEATETRVTVRVKRVIDIRSVKDLRHGLCEMWSVSSVLAVQCSVIHGERKPTKGEKN